MGNKRYIGNAAVLETGRGGDRVPTRSLKKRMPFVSEDQVDESPRPKENKRPKERVAAPLILPKKISTALPKERPSDLPVDLPVELPEESPFHAFGLNPSLLKALARLKFVEPTPIQSQTLATTLAGRDMIGCAQTGSGKTAAFCLPALQHLLEVKDKSVLVLVPTRELAVQIHEVFWNLSQFCRDLSAVALIGGEAMQRQLRRLKRRPRPQIWVATPGRLIDLMHRKAVRLQYVDFLVLDEADRMLDMGFAPQLKEIAAELPTKQQRQTMMFSATLPKEVEKLAMQFLNDPMRVSIGKPTGESKHVQQSIVGVTQKNKRNRLLDELVKRQGSTLVFSASKHRTDRLAKFLSEYGHSVTHIHGGRSQSQRQQALKQFDQGKSRILVATDIAARGLDIPHIETVINFDLPRAAEDYIHRIGRTARAGKEGEALSFLLPEDREQWNKIVKKCNLPQDLSIEVDERQQKKALAKFSVSKNSKTKRKPRPKNRFKSSKEKGSSSPWQGNKKRKKRKLGSSFSKERRSASGRH